MSKVGRLAVTLSHGEPRARTKGVDNEREHIAAVGVQRPIRIDAGLDQFSAKRQDRRSTVRGVAFGGADVRADELGADDRRLISNSGVRYLRRCSLPNNLPSQPRRSPRRGLHICGAWLMQPLSRFCGRA